MHQVRNELFFEEFTFCIAVIPENYLDFLLNKKIKNTFGIKQYKV